MAMLIYNFKSVSGSQHSNSVNVMHRNYTESEIYKLCILARNEQRKPAETLYGYKPAFRNQGMETIQYGREATTTHHHVIMCDTGKLHC